MKIWSFMREKVMTTPTETIDRLERLGLTDQEFRKIHHLEGSEGADETVDSHIEYLESINYYREGSNNSVVASRLEELESLEDKGIDRKNAIDICIANQPA